MKCKFHDVDQRSDEWFNLRAGKITGSALGKVMSGQETKGFKEIVNRLASERVFNKRLETDGFISKDMQNGIDLEPVAISVFEKETFIEVSDGGFWEYSDTVGDSPDGNFNDGTLEVKCVKYNTIEEYFEKGKIPNTYKWQCQHHLLCSGTETGYFMAYNELYKPFILEYSVDEELREKMLSRFDLINKLIERRMEFVKTLIK
jgi:putative phage-type endonuclease